MSSSLSTSRRSSERSNSTLSARYDTRPVRWSRSQACSTISENFTVTPLLARPKQQASSSNSALASCSSFVSNSSVSSYRLCSHDFAEASFWNPDGEGFACCHAAPRMTSNVFCHTYHQGGYPATPPGPLLGVASLRVVHASVSEEKGSPEISDLLRLVETFDAERLTRLLSADWRRLGPLEFLRARIAPLIRIVGEEWAAARLEIRHEHFLSERLGGLLRSLRLPPKRGLRAPWWCVPRCLVKSMAWGYRWSRCCLPPQAVVSCISGLKSRPRKWPGSLRTSVFVPWPSACRRRIVVRAWRRRSHSCAS